MHILSVSVSTSFIIAICLSRRRSCCTYRNVHQILKHIVFSQKKADRNAKCIVEAADGSKKETTYKIN